MAAPTIAAVGTPATSSGSVLTVAAPTGTLAGDLVEVAFWGWWHQSTTAPTVSALTPSAGLTLGGTYSWIDTADGYAVILGLGYAYAASGSDSWSITFGTVGGQTLNLAAGAARRISGGPTSGNPYVDTFRSASTGTWTTQTVASFTPGGDNTLLTTVAFAADTPTIPSGWTTDYDGATGYANYLLLAHATQATAAPTGALTFGAGAGVQGVLVGSIRAGDTRAVATADIRWNIAGATAWGAAVQRAASKTGTAKILTVGDSLAEGYGSSARANRWWDQLFGLTRTRYGIAGSGAGLIRAHYSTAEWATSPWSDSYTASGGTIGKTDAETVQGTAQLSLDSDAAYIEWSGITCDGFDVVMRKTTAGSSNLVVKVDGATVATISSNATSDTSSTISHVTLGTLASHTIRLTRSGSTSVIVDGITPYAGDYGAGLTGWESAHSGVTSGAMAPGTGTSNGWDNLQPDLVIDEQVGTNDAVTGASAAATVASRLTARINRYKALASNPTVVVYIPWADNYTGYAVDPNTYKDACATAATAAGALVLDMRALIPSPSSSWFASDGQHPNDAGYAQIAAAIDTYLAALAPTIGAHVGGIAPTAYYAGATPVTAMYIGATKIYG